MAKEIKFNIKLNIDGKEQIGVVTADVVKLRRAMEDSKSSAQQFRDKLLSINQAVTALQNFSGAITGLRDTMAGLTASYNAVQQANTQLTTVMRQRMNATDEDIKKVTEVISAQSKLGVIGGTVQKTGAQQIATFLKEKGTLEQLIPAMDDLLAQQRGLNASQEDARSVANLMGKAMTGQTSALKRVGITFDDAQEKIMKYGTEQQRASMLAQIITANVGHMNAQLGQTDAGKLKQAEMRFAGIKVQIGELVSKWLPQVTFTAQALSMVNSMISLGKSVQGVVTVVKSFNLLTKATSAACVAARSSLVGLSAMARVAQAAFTGASVGATTLKVAIKGLLISTGVGVAVAALTTVIEQFVAKSSGAATSAKDMSEAEAEAQQAQKSMQSEIANVTSALSINIAKLKEFKGSKAEEKKLVEEMNNTYGSAMGYYSTVAQWYTALTGNSKAYCDQMINEIRLRSLANQAADLQQQQHDVRYDDNGKLKKYSKQRKTRLRATGQVDAGDGKMLPTYTSEEIKGTSDLEKANAKLSGLAKKEQTVRKQMESLAKANSGTAYKHYDGYQATAPTLSTATPKAGKAGTSGSTSETEKKALEGSLDWYEQKMQELRKQIYATNNEQTAQGLQAQYEDLEQKSKALKINIGLEEPDTKAVKTYMEQLQDKLAAAQKDMDNATTIEARVAASAKIDEIQAEIDKATNGELSIKAEVEPSYIVKGSTADKRQSYQNAQNKASRVQQDYEIGIIGKDEAEAQIDEINQELATLGENLKPIKIEISNQSVEAIKSLGNIDVTSFDSVYNALNTIKSITDPTAKGLAAAGTACNTLGSAMQQLGSNSAAAKVGMILGAIGQIVLSYAQAMASASSNWVTWLAFGLSGTAELASIIGTLKGFSTGGVVSGSSTTGDKIPIRVNSGEMILTKSQQARLFAIANGQTLPQRTVVQPTVGSVGDSSMTLQVNLSGKLRGNDMELMGSNTRALAKKIGKTF